MNPASARFLATALCLASVAGAASAAPWQPSPGHTQTPIWPGLAPGTPRAADRESVATAEHLVAGKPWTYVERVTRPTLTVYPPRGANTGAAVVVFPGGGYRILAIDLEGTEVCDWLTSRGITCVLSKYRVPKTGPSWDADTRSFINPKPSLALEDAQRTMGLVRAHAAEWHVDPHKIGVLGFSAGGHLSAAIANEPRRIYHPVDAADSLSCRPDFAVSVYPGHLHVPGNDPHAFNPDIHVTAHTPPTFLVQAETDSIDGVNQSLVYYTALKDAGVPVEMHLYTNGGHAFGLRRTKDPITEWPQLVEKWLETIGILKP
jgi:acetyl esterase/lipase